MTEEWKKCIDEVLREDVERGIGAMEEIEQKKRGGLDFLSKISMDVWEATEMVRRLKTPLRLGLRPTADGGRSVFAGRRHRHGCHDRARSEL